MSKLNKDVIFLIIKELADDGKSLHSCLLVNRTWCETTIPILWRNPSKFCIKKDKKEILFIVLLLNSSEESRKVLNYQKINHFTYRQPLFNYISHWRYLDLYYLEDFRKFNSIDNISNE